MKAIGLYSSLNLILLSKTLGKRFVTFDELRAASNGEKLFTLEIDYLINKYGENRLIDLNESRVDYQHDLVVEILSCNNFKDLIEILVYNNMNNLYSVESLKHHPLLGFIEVKAGIHDILSDFYDYWDCNFDYSSYMYDVVECYCKENSMDTEWLHTIDFECSTNFDRFCVDYNGTMSVFNKFRNDLYNDIVTRFNQLPESFKDTESGLKFIKVKEVSWCEFNKDKEHIYTRVDLTLFANSAGVILCDDTFITLDFNRFVVLNLLLSNDSIVECSEVNTFLRPITFNTAEQVAKHLVDQEFIEGDSLHFLITNDSGNRIDSEMFRLVYESIDDKYKKSVYNFNDVFTLKDIKLAILNYIICRLVFKIYPEKLDYVGTHLDYLIADTDNYEGFSDEYVAERWGDSYLQFSRKSSNVTFGYIADYLISLYTDIYFGRDMRIYDQYFKDLINNKSLF